RGQTINADHYCTTLEMLLEVIRCKMPGRFSEGVILLHDKAPYCSRYAGSERGGSGGKS
ncbi:hypothetical protein TNIN_158171, partial [Trichonephila inaurata madagascariensis]